MEARHTRVQDPELAGRTPPHAGGHGKLRCLAAIGLGLLPLAAGAHVRWFTTVADPRTPPLALTELFTALNFLPLFVLTLIISGCVHVVDARLRARPNGFTHLLDRADEGMTSHAATLMRLGLALYFACIACYFSAAPITLTPELTVSAGWVVPLQLAIAACLLFPAGVIPGCAGILLLYVYSASVFGFVHLLDYHLFLGVCALLVLDRVSRQLGRSTGLLLLRLLVASSFIWVGLEKWLYPEWTQEVLEHKLPMLMMCLDPAFFAMAAGFVEIALAFLVLFGGVSSQVAAAALLVLMASAIPLVGMVDAIGHLPMLAALWVLATTRNRVAQRMQQQAAWNPLEFCGLFLIAVPGLAGLYFLTHEIAARSLRQEPAADLPLSLWWSAVFACWACHALLRGWQQAHGRLAQQHAMLPPTR
jgi:uncharacterized membrane protein YphA (DoxX/SURF4 family)